MLNKITSRGQYELRVDLEQFSGEKAYATYSTFSVGPESAKFVLTLDGYCGTAGLSNFLAI